jgi:5-formyltetrahydrofolate cyclo-ligase
MTEKERIRREVVAIRDSMPPEIKAEKDELIRQSLLKLREYDGAKVILLYASFRSEANTLKILDGSLSAGKRILLPKVDREKRGLAVFEIEDLSELFPGFMGIPEPLKTDGRMRSIDYADLVIVPGVAFDGSGNRLGYGAGYYDMLLSERTKNIPVVALAYEEQIVDVIHSEKHDIRVDIIVTDKRIIRT